MCVYVPRRARSSLASSARINASAPVPNTPTHPPTHTHTHGQSVSPKDSQKFISYGVARTEGIGKCQLSIAENPDFNPILHRTQTQKYEYPKHSHAHARAYAYAHVHSHAQIYAHLQPQPREASGPKLQWPVPVCHNAPAYNTCIEIASRYEDVCLQVYMYIYRQHIAIKNTILCDLE